MLTDPPKEHGDCPCCGVSLDGGGIWNHFYTEFQTTGYWRDENGRYTQEKRILTPEEAEIAADEVAQSYGATRTKGRWGRAFGIEDSSYDGVAAWGCPDCKAIWSRWTGDILPWRLGGQLPPVLEPGGRARAYAGSSC